MWYKASSVIKAVEKNNNLFIDTSDPNNPPSCPKRVDAHDHCRNDFPNCEGKTIDEVEGNIKDKNECSQYFRLKNKKDDPIVLHFYYYNDKQSRDGRIKMKNSTLSMIRRLYGLDLNLLEPV